MDGEVRPDRARSDTATVEESRHRPVVDNFGVLTLVVHLPDLPHKRPHLLPQREKIGGAGEQVTRIRTLEHPNRRRGLVNEHLGDHKLPNQEDEPMEEPEEAGAGVRSPSPEYKDPIESEAPMDEPKVAGAQSQGGIKI